MHRARILAGHIAPVLAGATLTATALSSSHCAASGPLAGRTVLVTGSNRGLGLEFVRQLKEQGATVIATCRTPAKAQALNDLGVRVEALDTSDIRSVTSLAERLTVSGVVIDILINNAGIASKNHPFDPIVEADPTDMLRVINTNVAGRVSHLALSMRLDICFIICCIAWCLILAS